MAVLAQPVPAVPPGAQFRLVATVAAGAFVTAFDSSAVNASLPLLREAFGAPVGAIQWVVTAGLGVTTALLLFFGRLGDMAGHRRIYLWGFGAFLPGALLCALAGTLPALIAARAFQGVGAAMLLASSPALLTRSLPAGQRGLAFGAKAACLYLGLIAGPVLGVWMAGRFGWRAVFWIQAPLALAVLGPALRVLPRDAAPATKPRFDFAGAAIWACIPISLLLMLGSNRELPLGLSRAALVPAPLFLLTALAMVERRRANPLLDFSCFRRVEFSASVAGLLAAFASSYALQFALPFYVMEVLRHNNAAAGGLLATGALARAVVAPFAGRWSDRVDARWLTVSGMLLLAASLSFLSRAGEGSPMPAVSTAVIAAGIALGCFVPANNSTLMDYARPGGYGAASGILTTARTLGMSAGAAIAGSMLARAAPLAQGVRAAFGAGMLLALAAAAASWLAPAERSNI